MRLEPEWWAEARKLRERQYSIKSIAHTLDKAPKSVRYVLFPEFREKMIKQSVVNNRKRTELGKKRIRDHKRETLRKVAKEEFRENGGDLREIYRRYGCL